MTAGTKARLAAQIAALQAQLEAEDELGIYEGANGFFHIALRLPNGRQTTRRRARDGSRLASRAQALRAKGEWEAAFEAGAVVIGRARFDALWPTYLRAAKAEMSDGAWADVRIQGTKRLLSYLGDTQVNRWNYSLIEAWRGDMLELVEAGDLAPKTANNARIALMGFCKWAVRNGNMAFNPVAEVKPLKVEDSERPFLKMRELHAYFDACSTTYRPLARTLVGTGARISEALALKLGDFDPVAGTLAVNRQLARDTANGLKTKETKGRKRRTVFIGSELVAVLDELLAARRRRRIPDGGWLFLVAPPTRGRYASRTEPRPPHRKTVHDWHEQALLDAGLDDLPLHGLRHTAAALWLSTGRSLEFVRAQLGHSSVQVTSDFYGHMEEDFRALGAAATEQAIRDALR